jgi:hypothetical protein
MSFEDILNRHNDCKVVILPRFHKNRNRLIDGLYCECHCKLIKWLTPELSKELQASGVELIAPIKQDKINLLQKKLKTEYIPRGGWL